MSAGRGAGCTVSRSLHDEVPSSGGCEPVVRHAVFSGGNTPFGPDVRRKDAGLIRVPNPRSYVTVSGKVPPQAVTSRYVGRSERFGIWLRISRTGRSVGMRRRRTEGGFVKPCLVHGDRMHPVSVCGGSVQDGRITGSGSVVRICPLGVCRRSVVRGEPQRSSNGIPCGKMLVAFGCRHCPCSVRDA